MDIQNFITATILVIFVLVCLQLTAGYLEHVLVEFFSAIS
jgi:hypothetical protein